VKPLGMKAYGSTPHLIGSRVGPGDHHCHEGQVRICTEKTPDRNDRIILTEKLDGSNVCIANVGGDILALTRAGYKASTSPYEQHWLFDRWVQERHRELSEALPEGFAIHGEWLAMAHGTRYALPHGPLVVFGASVFQDKGRTPLPWSEVVKIANDTGLPLVSVLSDGPPVSIEDARKLIAVSRHGAIGPVEGAVWRVERAGKLYFIAKWVDPDKKDGCLLPKVSGGPAIWNWRPANDNAHPTTRPR